MTKPKPVHLIEVPHKARSKNSARVEFLKMKGHYTRLERDRPSDLVLIDICLRPIPPEHVRQVHTGIFAVDLPADVFKIVWMVTGGYYVGTYANKMDRAEDL